MLLSHQCKGRTAWGGAVIQWSFANEFWIWWRREAGLTSAERAELLSARRRIHELETELAIHRRAAELLKGTTSPKGGSLQST